MVKKYLLRQFFSLIILNLLLGGCAVGPDFEPPQPPHTHSYTESELPEKTAEAKGPGGQAQQFIVGKDIPGCWWYLFHSEPLNELIERALKKNPTLEAAQATLRQAEENLKVSIASLFPFVSAQYSEERERFSGAIFGLGGTQPITFNLYNATVSVTYVLDVFGGIRRQIEASEAQLNSQAFQVEATYLTLTSNIVTTAIAEASLRAQIQATEELIAAQEKILEITNKQFKVGATTRIETLAQETLRAQTIASLPLLQNSLAKTRHALSVLVGDLPSESQLPLFSLSDLELPRDLPVSLPSCLIRQRPDVRAAEALLHAASAQIGVATANLFPQITLSGGYGYESNKFRRLFVPDSIIWNIIANAAQPLFQGGALIAKREAAIAAFEQAYAQYRQTVLQAFQNVADTLRALENDARLLKIQKEAEESALKSFLLVQAQYKVGAVNYLSVLDAESQYQKARLDCIQAQAARYADTAALFQALGGGWWNRPPLCPSPEKRR